MKRTVLRAIHGSAAVFALLAIMSIHVGGVAHAADSYVFDKHHTQIRFSWNHLGLSNQSAQFKNFDGAVTFDQNAPDKSSVNVTIRTAGVATGIADFDKHLKSADFFDVEKFPEITFKSTKVVQTGTKTGRIFGDLTIKGITRPVTLDVVFNYAGPHPLGAFNAQYKDVYAAGFSARTSVLRSDFDLGKYAPLVSDRIDIEINTELHRSIGE